MAGHGTEQKGPQLVCLLWAFLRGPAQEAVGAKTVPPRSSPEGGPRHRKDNKEWAGERQGKQAGPTARKSASLLGIDPRVENREADG